MTLNAESPVFGRPDFSECAETNVRFADPGNLAAGFSGSVSVRSTGEILPVSAGCRIVPETETGGYGFEFSFRLAPEDARRLSVLTKRSEEELKTELARSVPPETRWLLAKLTKAVTGVRNPFVRFRAGRVRRTGEKTGEFGGSLKILVPGRELRRPFEGFWEGNSVTVFLDAFPEELPLPFGTAGAARIFKREFIAFAGRNRLTKFRALPEIAPGALRITMNRAGAKTASGFPSSQNETKGETDHD